MKRLILILMIITLLISACSAPHATIRPQPTATMTATSVPTATATPSPTAEPAVQSLPRQYGMEYEFVKLLEPKITPTETPEYALDPFSKLNIYKYKNFIGVKDLNGKEILPPYIHYTNI